MTVHDNRDDLDRILADTVEELPEKLQQRLQRIPARRLQLNWPAILTLLFLAPLVVRGAYQLIPYLTELLTRLSFNPEKFAIATLFSGGVWGWVPATVLIGVVLFTLFVLRDELVWR